MATLIFNQLADMLNFETRIGTLTSRSSSKLVISDANGNNSVYYGNFSFYNSMLSGGTVTGYESYQNGNLSYTANDFSHDIVTVFNIASSGGPNALIDFVLSGNDQIIGSMGNDVLLGSIGNDQLDGKDGIDTVVIDSLSTNTDVHKDNSVWISNGKDGYDTLTNIERVRFSDANLALDIEGNAGKVAKILGAVFGASSVTNKSYANIGLSLSDNGMSYSDLAALAIDATGIQSNDEIVTLLWTNVVGLTPTTEDKAPFIELLNEGMSRGDLGVLAAETSQNAINIDLLGLQSTGLYY